MSTEIERRFQTVWSDYIIKDTVSYNTEIDLNLLTASTSAISTALTFFDSYSGYDTTAYGEDQYTTGLTEQQAYDNWISSFNKQQIIVKKQLIQNSIKQPEVIPGLPQCVYDGLVLYHWATGKVFNVDADESLYEMLPFFKNNDYDTIANMMMRSNVNRKLCIKAATVLRLADYGHSRSRLNFRTNGIHNMREQNELDSLDSTEIRRARFAYFAETGSFLPFSPESTQRDVVRAYNQTLVKKTFIFDATSVFKLEKPASMTPVEKLAVTINDNIQQHLYDFTVVDDQLTISKSMVAGDIITAIIKI